VNVLPFIRDPAKQRVEDLESRLKILRALEDAQGAILRVPLDQAALSPPEVLALLSVVMDLWIRRPRDGRTATGPAYAIPLGTSPSGGAA
jgi:hypothetical protein